MAETDASLPPVLVGGAQRSGTHVVGHLIGRSAGYHMLGHELVLHASDRGLVGYLAGVVDAGRLVRDLRGFWWHRTVAWDAGGHRGLFKLVSERQRAVATAAFLAADRTGDRAAAARALLDGIGRTLAAAAGKHGWVEMSPSNLTAAGALHEMLPDARFVCVLRDPRDVVCSQLALPWGPTTPAAGLRHWAAQVRRASDALASVPEALVLRVELEDLVLTDGAVALDRLRAFVGHAGDKGMSDFLAHEVTPERAHLGRWRTEIPEPDRASFTAAAAALCDELAAEGNRLGPRLRNDVELSLPGDEHATPHPFDPWSDGIGRRV